MLGGHFSGYRRSYVSFIAAQARRDYEFRTNAVCKGHTASIPSQKTQHSQTLPAMTSNETAERYSGAKTWHLALQSTAMFILFLVPQLPRQSVGFPFLLGALSLFFFLYVERDLRRALKGHEERWLLAALFGFAGYLFLNSLWSQVPFIALGKTVFVLLMIILTLIVSRAFALQSRETLESAALYALIGAVIGSAITCIEFSTDHIIGRSLYSVFPLIRPGDKTISVLVMENGRLVELPQSEFRKPHANVVIEVSSAALNRIHSFRMLLLWPILYLAMNYVRPKLGAAFACFISLAAAYTIFVGESQTSQAALVLSAVVFFVARAWSNLVHWTLLGAWCVAVGLAVPLAVAPYKAGLFKAEWIAPSFRDRMIIWGFTGEKVLKSPVLGIGIRSTRVLGKEIKKTQERLPGHIVPKRLGLHSHNNFLQVWFELGAVGALFVLLIGIGLLQGIRRLLLPVRPYAYATFAAACLVAAFGWGLWQTWLLAGYSLAVMMVVFTDSYARRINLSG